MSDQSQGPGWWMASDGRWYPPQPDPGQPTGPQPPVTQPAAPPPGAPYGAIPASAPPAGPSKSSAPLLIGLAVLVVVVLLGGLAFALTRPKTDVAAPPTTTTPAPTTTTGGGSPSTTGKQSPSTTDGGDDTSTTAKGKTTTTKGKQPSANFPAPKDPEGAIAEAGLPALTEEGSVVHLHTHLDVIVNGKSVTVPANIGIASTTISPLHTHDKSGVVHIEANATDELTTAQFFTEWEVKLTKDCVGDFCADDDHHQLLGFVNGEQVDDPSQIVFAEHDEVVIWYGTPSDRADVPSSYDFPAGL